MTTITYTPNHTRKNDWVSSIPTSVQAGNDARFAGFHAHGDQLSMAATSCGSHAVIECCFSKQSTGLCGLEVKHASIKKCVKLLHPIRVGSYEANPNVSDSRTKDVGHVKLANISAQKVHLIATSSKIVPNSCTTWVLEGPPTIENAQATNHLQSKSHTSMTGCQAD